jgi:hypothetical protein
MQPRWHGDARTWWVSRSLSRSGRTPDPLASCDLGSYDGFREELNRSYGLVAERLFDRSADLVNLSNDALARRHVLPAGPALIEPLNDDPREHPDNPAQKIRHPRNVRILPPSRDFH